MALPRNSITDFEVANAPYALSAVTVHIANPDGSKGALATLYSSLTGLGTLPNPQTLDNTGKWQQPVYIDTDYILSINSPLDPLLDHDTGVVRYGGRWRDLYTGAGTRYNIDDLLLGPVGEAEESNVYRSQSIWTSTDWATDVADSTKLVLELDYQALRTLALNALPDASETVKGKIEIATQAETNTGTDDVRAITPLKLASRTATETRTGIAEIATQTEVNTGANDTMIVTPAKLHARVASETLQGLIAIATQTDVDTATNDTEAVTPTKLWTAPMRSGDRNVLGANGNFNVWQRGAGGAASIAVAASTTAYTADRWYITTGANQASVVSQGSGVAGFNRFYAQVQRNAGQTGTGSIFVGFPLDTDEVVAMRGKTLSVRFKAQAGADFSPTSSLLPFQLRFGTGSPAKRSGGAFAGETTVINTAASLSPGGGVTEHTFTATAVVPSDATQGEFFFLVSPTGTAGANDWFRVSDIVLEEGPRAGSGLFPSFEQQLRACMRHFWKTFAYDTAPASSVGTTAMLNWRGTATGAVATSMPQHINHPAKMRSETPTITLYSPAAGSEVRNLTDATACSGSSAVADAQKLIVTYTATAGSAVNESFGIHLTADAGI
jgi:hypothetical protein